MVRVYDLAHCRAGDKGNTSNISVVAYNEAGWRVIREQLTPELVLAAYAHIAKGPVRRYGSSQPARAQLRHRERAWWWRHAIAAPGHARQELELPDADDRTSGP